MRPHRKTKLGFFPLPLKNGCLRHLAVRWPIFPKPDKRRTATDCIDWWKRCTIGAPRFGLIEQVRESTRDPFPNWREPPA
jgi:hypothetical protein